MGAGEGGFVAGTALWWMTAASISLLVVGACGPWVAGAGVVDIADADWLLILIVVTAALPFWVWLRSSRWCGTPLLVAGIACFSFTLDDRSRINQAIARNETLTQTPARVGWGLDLATLGAVAVAIAGLVWLLARQGHQIAATEHDDVSDARTPAA